MRIRVSVKRRKSPDDAPYIQKFNYEYEDEAETVASMLRALNNEDVLTDTDGNEAPIVEWECSCLQKKCGACAMLINGIPRLACDVRLTECGDEVTLAPLRKFPTVRDLRVDRSAMMSELSSLSVFLKDAAEDTPAFDKKRYELSLCLQCGCCLEICPNFVPGGEFGGMAGAVPLSRVLMTEKQENLKTVSKTYRKKIFEGCGKSLACKDICPAGIDTDKVLARSNAVALWNRKRRNL